MKKHILILTSFLLVFFANTTVWAQDSGRQATDYPIKKKGKYALLVDNPKYFMASVISGEELREASPAVRFEIVLIGPVVKDLAENNELMPFIERAQQAGVKLVVCEFAMNQLRLRKDQFHASILFTPNGFTYLWGLQDNGFKTIEL